MRCAPHVIGVLEDALPFFRAADRERAQQRQRQPAHRPRRERVLHGGHFYGGHIAFAMDALKNAVANVADLMDRQMALLVDTRYNHGLPANLSRRHGPRAAINHGLKALQIGVVGVDRRGAQADHAGAACSRAPPSATTRTR